MVAMVPITMPAIAPAERPLLLELLFDPFDVSALPVHE